MEVYKFESRQQQRMVTEIMDNLLLALRTHTDAETTESIDITLDILHSIEVKEDTKE